MATSLKDTHKALYNILDKHQRCSETQKPSPARLRNLRFTQEWIDNPESLRDTLVNIDLPQELYITCVSFFKSSLRKITEEKSVVDKNCLNNLKEELGRLHLWGLDFIDGKLATVLYQSDELRNNILELLSDIAQLLINSTLILWFKT